LLLSTQNISTKISPSVFSKRRRHWKQPS